MTVSVSSWRRHFCRQNRNHYGYGMGEIRSPSEVVFLFEGLPVSEQQDGWTFSRAEGRRAWHPLIASWVSPLLGPCSRHLFPSLLEGPFRGFLRFERVNPQSRVPPRVHRADGRKFLGMRVTHASDDTCCREFCGCPPGGLFLPRR